MQILIFDIDKKAKPCLSTRTLKIEGEERLMSTRTRPKWPKGRSEIDSEATKSVQIGVPTLLAIEKKCWGANTLEQDQTNKSILRK